MSLTLTKSFSYDFTVQPDANPLPNPPWIGGFPGNGGFDIQQLNGAASPSEGGTPEVAMWSGPSLPGDQYATVQGTMLNDGSDTPLIGPEIRSDVNNIYSYTLTLGANGDSATMTVTLEAFTPSLYEVVLFELDSVPYVSGLTDFWTLAAVGNQLFVLQNKVVVGQVSGDSGFLGTGGYNNLLIGAYVAAQIRNPNVGNSQTTYFEGGIASLGATATIQGFAPSTYFGQQNNGLGIWIATGTFNGAQKNGQFVAVNPNSTTYISLDSNGNLVSGAGPGTYPIAKVVSGNVITSGNLPSNTPWGGAFIPNSKFTLLNVQFSPGIQSITDLRTF